MPSRLCRKEREEVSFPCGGPLKQASESGQEKKRARNVPSDKEDPLLPYFNRSKLHISHSHTPLRQYALHLHSIASSARLLPVPDRNTTLIISSDHEPRATEGVDPNDIR